MLTNLKIPKTMDLLEVPPLDDIEVDERMRHFEQLVNELEWRRTKLVGVETETECNKIDLEKKERIAKIESSYRRREGVIKKETKIEMVRSNNRGNLMLLDEMDKHVTDVLMAVHHRLGRIDYQEHKRAYKRILYALLVQGLCRVSHQFGGFADVIVNLFFFGLDYAVTLQQKPFYSAFPHL